MRCDYIISVFTFRAKGTVLFYPSQTGESENAACTLQVQSVQNLEPENCSRFSHEFGVSDGSFRLLSWTQDAVMISAHIQTFDMESQLCRKDSAEC
jgi:hypothetical protein